MPRKRNQQPEDFFAPFPSRLREQMERQGITQQDLADFLGVTRQSVAAYTSGSSSPYWEGIVKICDFLSVSADFLLGRSDTPSRSPEVQDACSYSGLSQEAVETLHGWADGNARFCYLLSEIVTDPRAEALLESIHQARLYGSLPEEELVRRHTPLMQATAASLGQDVATALTQMATMAHASGTTLLTPSENARYRQQEAERIFRNIIENIATGGAEIGTKE